ncbi:hypothetical protein [Streptomyces sp. NPDC058718]|uniref:hypothetical protein n=1 Tax=Streptomyces sp. NPDC058718 TaxID=3346610 RepID=UPI003695C660
MDTRIGCEPASVSHSVPSASFSRARLITGGTWTGRDVVTADDFNGDGTPDLLFRGTVADQGLMLRKGKPSGGGVDLDSLATCASSLTGEDVTYGTGGRLKADMPFIIGIPDVNKVAASGYSRAARPST